MGMEIEMGNWVAPLIMSGAAFGFAFLSSGQRAVGCVLGHRLRCALLYGLATIASAFCWLAWARVIA